MKKAIIGGFLSLSGMIGLAGVMASAAISPINGWTTPPGRLITTVLDNGTLLSVLISAVLLVLGLAIISREYFNNIS